MQSKTAAVIEKVSETSAGFAINFTVLNWLLNPFLDMNLHAQGSLFATVVFTILSFGRGYIFRRLATIYAEQLERVAEFLRSFLKKA